MALWAYALRTVAQVKASSWLATGTTTDSLIEDCVNEASAMVEKAWGRHLVSRGGLTEFHPRLDSLGAATGVYVPLISGPAQPVSYGAGAMCLGAELYTNEYPIVSLTTVHEDSARAYGAGALLVADTDFVLSKPAGKLIRISGSGGTPRAWVASWRAVKVVYIAGYQDTSGSIVGAAAVPPEVLKVFDDLVAWMIRLRVGKEQALASMTNGMGSLSFLAGPPMITSAMQAALDAAGATPSLRIRTGERDA